MIAIVVKAPFTLMRTREPILWIPLAPRTRAQMLRAAYNERYTKSHTLKVYPGEAIRLDTPRYAMTSDHFRFFVGPVSRDWFEKCQRMIRTRGD